SGAVFDAGGNSEVLIGLRKTGEWTGELHGAGKAGREVDRNGEGRWVDGVTEAGRPSGLHADALGVIDMNAKVFGAEAVLAVRDGDRSDIRHRLLVGSDGHHRQRRYSHGDGTQNVFH